MAELRIDRLGKRFGEVAALDDVSIVAEEGRFLTLLGPSGCGKSTTLWSVAGLHVPDAGTISIGDQVVFDAARGIAVPPEERACGVVFQSYAVWPHMTVADNVGYPLKLRKVGRVERRRRVVEVLELVELGRFADRYPHQLSGGQQQRVALARALAYQPRLLLLDEPFSNLDAKLRDRARTWLRDLQQRVGITTVFVTHDQDEALSMSDRVVVMDYGRVVQVGTPEEVYLDPADGFVADFVGSINLLPGEVLRVGEGTIEFLADGTTAPVHVHVVDAVAPGRATLAVRPEAITFDGTAEGDARDDALRHAGAVDRAHVDRNGGGAGAVVPATAVARRFLGDHYRHTVTVGTTEVVVQTQLSSIPDRPLLRLPAVCKVFAERPTAAGPVPSSPEPVVPEESR